MRQLPVDVNGTVATFGWVFPGPDGSALVFVGGNVPATSEIDPVSNGILGRGYPRPTSTRGSLGLVLR